MRKKATTLHPFYQTRQAESDPCSSSVEPRVRRPKTERQQRGSSRRVSGVLAGKDVPAAIQSHLTDFAGGTVSPRTTEKKREFLGHFAWFIENQHCDWCNVETLRAYFAYLNQSHKEPGGRWNNGRPAKPLRPATVDTHYRVLCAFFNWLVREERIAESPMRKVAKSKVPDDHVEPLSDEQMEALLKAARNSRYPKRDYAIVALFYDTGIRASELAGLRVGDIEWQSKRLDILGKGNKKRPVYADDKVMQALTAHLQQDGESLQDISDKEFVFVSQRGTNAGEPMNRNALYKLIKRLGKVAGISRSTRCSPHTLRHSYAIASLRNGRDVYSLQRSLGHTTLKMTSRYVALSSADLKRAQEETSPLAALKKRGRGR